MTASSNWRAWTLAVLLAVCAAWMTPSNALSQGNFPDKPIRLIVPQAPGSATDLLARSVSAEVEVMLNQKIIVENKPGAAFTIGLDLVAKAAPDGYTLGMVVTAHVINPSLRAGLPYDTLKDLAAVTQVSAQQLVIAAHPSLAANNIAELIELARRRPGELSYATPGSGTAMHLSVELLKTTAGINLVHVPYKGGAPAQQDVMGGRVPILLDVLYAVTPLIDAGKIKVIALLGPQRTAKYPVVAETVPGVSAISMVGIVAPSGLKNELLEQLGSDIAGAVKSSDLTERMKQLGMEPVGSSPREFDALIRAEMEKWAKVVKASGARAD